MEWFQIEKQAIFGTIKKIHSKLESLKTKWETLSAGELGTEYQNRCSLEIKLEGI